MKKSNRIMNYSLLATLCAMVVADSYAAIRAGNQTGSYASSYKNSLALQQQYQNYLAETQAAQAAAATESGDANTGLPVRVADAELAARIKNGDTSTGVTVEHLDDCASIYPTGEFVWDKPTLGHMAGGPATCVAVVEMRVMGQVKNGQEYAVTARGKLAAGDAMKCNIAEFPQSTYLPDIVKVEFPADEKPTREDVIRVMNEEQKQKAGLKIGGALLVGLVGGNAVGRGEPGNEKMFGLNSEKIKTSLIGGAGAASVMAASVYSGKVAGDVILSAGVNAAAGAVTGNMYDAVTGSGDTLLHVEKCRKKEDNKEVDCLWGTFKKQGDELKGCMFYNVKEKTVMYSDNKDCDENCDSNCKEFKPVSNFIFGTIAGAGVLVSGLEGKDYKAVLAKADKYKYDESIEGKNPFSGDPDGEWVKITGSHKTAGTSSALVYNYPESRKGTTSKDFSSWKSKNWETAEICLRDAKGDAYNCSNGSAEGDFGTKKGEFKAITKSSSDGAIVDFSDKTRTKDTLKGAAVGAGAGGLSAYQGAQDDIDARYIQSMDEYNASLREVYCGTGKKVLGQYNNDIEIPEIGE